MASCCCVLFLYAIEVGDFLMNIYLESVVLDPKIDLVG